jgi:hypothetical protein
VVIMVGMLVLGSGGGLLNGETQKAIMSAVPRERAGMASGISTTSRFSGILLGFAVLSGILSTVTRAGLTNAVCAGGDACRQMRRSADTVVAGDLPHALIGLTGPARDLALAEAHHAYSGGFSAALAAAALGAALSALLVGLLMRRGAPGPPQTGRTVL